MGRSLLILAVALFTAIPIRAGTFLEEVKEKFASINSFTAVFAQTTTPVMGDTQQFEGTIDLARPAKVRMEVSSPEKQLIVYNGERGWLYLPEQNICYTYDKERIGNLSRIPEYVFDPFEKLTTDTSYTTDSRFVIGFVAPEHDPFIERMDLSVTKASLLPRELYIRDRSGTIIEYSFSAVTINVAENANFTFTPPEGTEVIEQ